MMLQGLDFFGAATDKPPKPKKVVPTVAPPLPTPVAVNKSAFPTWLPYAVGIAGMGVIVILLVTSKKD